MTALDTARLLALLTTGRLLSPENTEAVLKLMKREVKEQKHLKRRIAAARRRFPAWRYIPNRDLWGNFCRCGHRQDSGFETADPCRFHSKPTAVYRQLHCGPIRSVRPAPLGPYSPLVLYVLVT